MRFLAFLCLLALSANLVPAYAADNKPAPAPMFGAKTSILENGLRVVAINNPRAPVVTHMVWYKVGSADEDQGKTGLAHFLEHLMFKGSKNVAPGQLSKSVRKMGGNDNAFTTQDYTAYFQNVSSDHLRDVMRMEADRMNNATFPESEFDSEHKVIQEERRQNIENDPRAFFVEQLRYALFPGHPYGKPVIGWQKDIENLTRQDAIDFYNKWYAPNNAILVVAGDITLEKLLPLAQEFYGQIPSKQIRPTPLPAAASFPGQARYTLTDPALRQPMIIWMTRAPGYIESKRESLALQVLMEALSGSPATRLYKSLVVDQKLATSASIGYQDSSRYSGTVSATLIPAEGIDMNLLEAAFLNELEKVASSGITETELNEAIMRLKDSADFARDSLSGPARVIGEFLSIGASLDDIEFWASDIESVTLADVTTVARAHLAKDKAGTVVGYILPPEKNSKHLPEQHGETP